MGDRASNPSPLPKHCCCRQGGTLLQISVFHLTVCFVCVSLIHRFSRNLPNRINSVLGQSVNTYAALQLIELHNDDLF